MEDAFFHRVDQQLREAIRAEIVEKESEAALKVALGVSDHSLLAELVAIGVQPETVAAIALIPLVAVAWADGKVDDNQRRRILEAEQELHIRRGSPSHRLLEHWLDENPGEDSLLAWKHYVSELRGKLTGTGTTLFDKGLYDSAYAIAKTSGGFCTYGAISPSEKRILKQLKQTLKTTAD